MLRVQQLCCSICNCYILQKGEKTQGFIPQPLCHHSTQINPLLTLCLTNELWLTHRASSATNEVTPGSPSPRANPSLHPLLQSGETPWLPDRKVSQEFSPHSNGELLSCTPGIMNSSACCSPIEVTEWAEPWGQPQLAALEAARVQEEDAAKLCLKIWSCEENCFATQGYQTVSSNKLGINHVLNVS